MDIKSKPYSDNQRWICVYPVYLNSKKTQENGRKISLEKAIDNPTVGEIYDIINHAGLKCVIERNKMHPRDQVREPNFQGRVRVQMRNDDGSFCDDKFKTRKSILIYTAEMIPKLKTRQPGASIAPSQQPTAAGKKKKKR